MFRWVLAALVLVAACAPKKRWNDREVDHDLVRIASDKAAIRTDTIGHDQWESVATFALVDAENTHTEDLMVTLAGELLDAGGEVVGKFQADSLRIPAGGVRTFALIDGERVARPTATQARFTVDGAHVPPWPPPVQVTDGKAFKDNNRAVAFANIVNTADRPVKVLVLAGFHDADNRPMKRPFTLMKIGAEETHPAQFVGPEGSVTAYIFIGQLAY